MKPRKIPLRTCIGCGVIRPKRELARITFDEQENLIVDVTGKLRGRGAYLCRSASEIQKVQEGIVAAKDDTVITVNKACLEEAKEKHAFNRSFKKKIEDIKIS